MFRSAKEALSPRRVPAEVVELPFDLGWTDLHPALPRAADSREPRYIAKRNFELQGLRGRDRSAVVSVEHEGAGSSPSIDLFIKIADPSELENYRLVQRAGVPVPRLLLDVPRPNGEMALVFEFLDTIGIDVGETAEAAELLRLVAQLNVVPPPPGGRPPPEGLPEAEFTELVRQALATVSDLGLCRLPVDAWLGAYQRSKGRAATSARATTHGEFHFQQVGRRAGGSLVVFDFATLGDRPRFFDVCNIIGPLAEGAGVAESLIFGQYLTDLRACGDADADADADAAFCELRWLRVLSNFESLPWLADGSTDPDLGMEHLQQCVATLERDMTDLEALH